MSLSVVTPARLPRRAGAGHRLPVVAGVLAISVLAFAIRFRLLTHGVGLIAPDGYDDGVYYAAADALVHGRLPYRDFLLLHPPGILLALAPFALLGRLAGDPVGVAAARLAFLGIGAANTAAITVLAGRSGRLAGALAGLTAAVLFPLAYAERSTLLEPLGTLLLLGALLLARRGGVGAVVLAGVLAGLSLDVKIWYVVPVLVLIAFQSAHRLRFALGAVAGAAAVGLPFLVADPVAMVREVLLDQLGRTDPAVASFTTRAVAIAGAPRVAGTGEAALRTKEGIAALVVVAALVAAVAALGRSDTRRYPVLLAATVLVLVLSPSFYLHYVGFTGPWLALTLGVGLARLLALLPGRGLRLGTAAVLVAALAAANLPAEAQRIGVRFPHAALAPAAAAVRGCVLSDDPAVLASLDVLSRDLADGCPVRPDVTGFSYDRDGERRDGRPVPLEDDATWQRDVLGYLTSGSAVILARSGTRLSAASRAVLEGEPIIARQGRWVLRRVTGRA